MNGRRAHVGIFAIDDRSVQLTWRDVGPGTVAIEAVEDRGAHERPVASPVEVLTDGGPGAAVVEDLPPGQNLRIRVTGDALGGAGSCLLSARTLDALPGEELTRVATIGDLHLGADAFGHLGTIVEVPGREVPHPHRCARAAIDAATGWGAERIVVKGDITNLGQREEWRTYAELADASIPLDALPGNHDRAHTSSRPGLLPEEAAAAFGFPLADPVLTRDLPGLRLVLVDTTKAGRNRGAVGEATDDVMEAVGGADREGSVLVALHHQLHHHRLPEGWPIGISHHESRGLLERLGGLHPRVLVTSGHTHRHRRWTHAGVTATQVGSTKDYPGVWAGYVAHDGGIRQIVRRVDRPDCLAWTEHTRRAAFGTWRWVAPGRLRDRCFDLPER